VADKTANAINDFSPWPSPLSYAAAFTNSKLPVTAKLSVADVTIAVAIGCLLPRAAWDRPSSRLRFRLPLGALFAGLSTSSAAAGETLRGEVHGALNIFLSIILIGLAAAFFTLLAGISLSSRHTSADDGRIEDRFR
jgi:hypothetical protein